jgi:hypothetical protein
MGAEKELRLTASAPWAFQWVDGFLSLFNIFPRDNMQEVEIRYIVNNVKYIPKLFAINKDVAIRNK